MKVYILTLDIDYEGSQVMYVFNNRKAAEAVKKMLDEKEESEGTTIYQYSIREKNVLSSEKDIDNPSNKFSIGEVFNIK